MDITYTKISFFFAEINSAICSGVFRWISFLLICFADEPVFCQNKFSFSQDGYYIIVGAFASPFNANHYVIDLKNDGFHASSIFVNQHQLYYIAIDRFPSLDSAREKIMELRKQQRFFDAWVYRVGSPESTSLVLSKEKGPSNPPESNVEPKQSFVPSSSSSSPDSVSEQTEERDVFLSLYNSTNDKIVPGIVKAIDFDKNKLLGKLSGNTYGQLPKPIGRSGKIILICESMGFRKLQRTVMPDKLINDTTASYIEDAGTGIVIHFDLVKYQRGDIRPLYSVYFFNDAVAMLPDSKYELLQLVEMMQQNSRYKIMLHGHSNGNKSGPIILADTANLFSMGDHSKKIWGSAQKLSSLRAETIKSFLVKNDIAPDRIKTKGWGGKRPLYDKNGPSARGNIRVEVEIIED